MGERPRYGPYWDGCVQSYKDYMSDLAILMPVMTGLFRTAYYGGKKITDEDRRLYARGYCDWYVAAMKDCEEREVGGDG